MPDKFPIPAFENGMVREAAVDESLVPRNSVELSQNLHFDRLGSATLRKGLTLLGTQLVDNTPILGLGSYRNNAGSNYKALAMVNTTVKAYDGASWANVRTGLTAGSRARFTSLVDYTFMVNGTANEVLNTYNGSGSFGTTNAASLPKGDYIENYRNRIWVAQDTVDKLYYSDVVTTSNTITGGTSFLQISPADGERIRALKRHPRALLVFKENHIYRVFNPNSADPDPAIFRGTYSQESVVEGKDGISYHHPTGFYDFVFEGEQQEISRPIIDIVQAIPRTYYDKVCGWADDDHKYWSIGDITLAGITFSNIVAARTISTKTWTIYSYGTEVRSAGTYDDGTTLHQLVGDDDGNVLRFNVGTTDNSTPIFYDLITHWMYFSSIKSTYKSLSQIAALHENAQGGNLEYQLDSDGRNGANKWRKIGTLARDIAQVDSLDARNFRRIRFRFRGSSSGSPFIFRGWEPLDLLIGGETRV